MMDGLTTVPTSAMPHWTPHAFDHRPYVCTHRYYYYYYQIGSGPRLTACYKATKSMACMEVSLPMR